MLSEPPMAPAVLTPVAPAPVALIVPPMNTLPLTGAVIDRAVVLLPVTETVPFCATSPCSGPSKAMPNELLPWTVTELPLWKVSVLTRGEAPVRCTP